MGIEHCLDLTFVRFFRKARLHPADVLGDALQHIVLRTDQQLSPDAFNGFFSKFDLYNLHFHHPVADSGKETEKAADRWVFQIVIAQHIAPA